MVIFFKYGDFLLASFVYLTQERIREIESEVKELKTNGRKKMAQTIAEARSFGDLSENAEYDAAKDAQGLLEAKIAELQMKIANARILDKSKINTDKVQILNKITIRNKKNNATMQYTIVPESEANLKENKISVKTPIASGLIGKKVGDTVHIKVPSGVIPFEIIDISI